MRAVGFTGTESGMTSAQEKGVKRLLRRLIRLAPVEDRPLFIHGGCRGADDQAAQQAHALGYSTMAWLGPDPDRRSEYRSDHEVPPLGEGPNAYLLRNEVIAQTCNFLIAAPKEQTEIVRSGTWSTVRYTRKEGKTVYVVQPDGRIDRERTADRPGRIAYRDLELGVDLRKVNWDA